MLDEGQIKELIKDKCDYIIQCIDEVDSTNNALKRKAVSDPIDGFLLFTQSQSGGRGRMGRSFFSPKSGLYLSLLFSPKTPPSQTTRFTAAAAVAVCRAIEGVTDLSPQIKWVNDVYLDGRKLCGILTETSITDGAVKYAIVGIGINLTPPDGGFPPEIAKTAGTLFEADAPENFANELAAALAVELYEVYNNEKWADTLKEYRRRSFLIGRQVTAVGAKEQRDCTVIGIDDEAALLVRYTDGTEGKLFSGEVSIRNIK